MLEFAGRLGWYVFWSDLRHGEGRRLQRMVIDRQSREVNGIPGRDVSPWQTCTFSTSSGSAGSRRSHSIHPDT